MMIHDSWVHDGDDDNVDENHVYRKRGHRTHQTTVGVSSFSPLYTWALRSGSGTLSRMTHGNSHEVVHIFFIKPSKIPNDSKSLAKIMEYEYLQVNHC